MKKLFKTTLLLLVAAIADFMTSKFTGNSFTGTVVFFAILIATCIAQIVPGRLKYYLPGSKAALNFLAGIENAVSKDKDYLKSRPITRRMRHIVAFIYSYSTWYHFWGAITGR